MIGIESGRSERGVVTIYIAAPILDITRHIRHNFAVERENDWIQWIRYKNITLFAFCTVTSDPDDHCN